MPPEHYPVLRWLLQLEDRSLSGRIVRLDDNSGYTRFGITSDNWTDAMGAAYWTSDVSPALALEMALDFYDDHYWQLLNLSQIALPFAASILSCAVNVGVGHARRFLEASKGDLPAFIQVWQSYYKALNKPEFLDGWLARSSAIYPELPK